jgi:hypothetical protein
MNANYVGKLITALLAQAATCMCDATNGGVAFSWDGFGSLKLIF